jgi:hypothetical protein
MGCLEKLKLGFEELRKSGSIVDAFIKYSAPVRQDLSSFFPIILPACDKLII